MRKNVRDFPVGAGRPFALAAPDIEALTDRMGTIAAYFVPMQGHIMLIFLALGGNRLRSL
jgi:hypothetical protein